MDMIEIFGRCSHCMIPNRLCWKSQEFISRGILYGDEQKVPISFCLLRSTIHEASLKLKEKMDKKQVNSGVTMVVKTLNLDIDSLDMTKKYWIN